MAEKSFSVRLAARVDQYIAAMKQAESATTKFSAGTQKNLSKLGGDLQSVGGKLTLGVTAPLAAAGVAAFNLSGKFDQSFTRMQSLAGVSASEIEGLQEAVKGLAGETGRSPIELADALYTLRSSGLDADDALSALEVSARASASGLGSTATIADAVSSAMNAYAQSGLEAADATDVLVATARAGKAEPEQLAASLGRVLPIASELGVTFQDVGGAIASLSLLGNDAATSSTLLTNILAKMLKPSQQGAEALEAVGMSADSIRSSISERGLLETLEDLRARLGDNGFARFLEDAQAVQGGLALTGQNVDNVRRTFDEVRDSAGAADEAFATWAESMGAKNARAWASFQTALLDAGDAILPIVTDIIGVVGDLAKSFSDLPKPVQTAVLGLLAVVAVAGPFAIFAGSVIKSLGAMGIAFDVMRGKALLARGGLIGLGVGVGIMAADIAGKKIDPQSHSVLSTEYWTDDLPSAIGEGIGKGKIFTRDFWGEATTGTANLAAANEGLRVSLAGTGDAVRFVSDVLAAYRSGQDAATGSTESAGMAMSDIYDLSLQGAAGLGELGMSADDTAQAMLDMRSAAIAALSPLFDHEKLGLQLAEGLMGLEDAVAEYNAGLADGTLKGKDQAKALIDIRQQTIANTETALAMAKAFADQSGAQEGSRKHTRLMRDELVRLASENPAIRGEIQQYIDKINAIKSKARTELGLDGKKKAEDDAGDVKGAIDDIPGSKTPRVTLDGSQVYVSADAIEQRLNAIPDENVTVRLHYEIAGGPHPPTFGAGTQSMTGGTSSMLGGTSSLLSKAAPRFSGASPAVTRLLDEADELVRLARATSDAEEAAELLDQAREKAERAADLHAKAINREARELDKEAEQLRRHADLLRDNAAAIREAAAERASALRAQAGSIRDAVDAELALHDAQRQTEDAMGRANRAFTTEGVSARDRAEALDDAREAALRLADAELERERARAAAQGRTLSDQEETRFLQRSLQRQAHEEGASPVGDELRRLLADMNFPARLRLEDRADAREARADRRADQMERTARIDDRNARAFERASNKLEKFADRIDRAKIGFGDQVQFHVYGNVYDTKQLRKFIEDTVNDSVRRARAGKR